MTTNSTLRDFLLYDPLAKFDREVATIEVHNRLNQFLPSPVSSQVIGTLVPFVSERPWRYWDSEIVAAALTLLENDTARTIEAIKIRGIAVNRGVENLFRPAPIILIEESFDHKQSRGLIRLATEFLPEYLRLAEHDSPENTRFFKC